MTTGRALDTTQAKLSFGSHVQNMVLTVVMPHQHHRIATHHRLGLGAKSSEFRVDSPAKMVVIFRHVEKTGGTYIALTLTLSP